MKYISIILITLLFAPKAMLAQDSLTLKTMRSLYKSGEFQKLEKQTRQELKIKSTNYYLLYYSAQSNLALGKYIEAYKQLTKAISIYPDSGNLYNNRGNMLMVTKEFEAAYVDFKNELRLAQSDEDSLAALLNISAAQMAVRNFELAAQNLEKAITIDSLDAKILNNLGNAYSELGKRKEAIKNLEKAIDLDSTLLMALNNLGFIYLQEEEYSKALKYFDMVLRVEKENPYTLNNRGYAKYKLFDNQGALKDINKSIKLHPSNSYAYRNRALVYITLQKNKKACLDLQTALDNDFTLMFGDEVNQLIIQHCK